MYHIFPNFNEHPTDPNYLVFTFRNSEMSSYFGEELEKKKIKFQYDKEINRNNKEIYYYAVLQSDRKASVELNLLTWAKFRKPFFHGVLIKIVLLVLMVSLISLGIIGYFKS